MRATPGTSSVRWAVADVFGRRARSDREWRDRAAAVSVPSSRSRRTGSRQALDRLDVRYIRDADGDLLAMWERHAVLFAIEGPVDEILVMRARPHATVPPRLGRPGVRVVNEWNHTRRFCKAYVGDPTDAVSCRSTRRSRCHSSPAYTTRCWSSCIDCGVSVSECFVNWLHDEGALL